MARIDFQGERTPYRSVFGHMKHQQVVVEEGGYSGVIKIEDVLNHKGEKVGEVCYCRTNTKLPRELSKTFSTPEDMLQYLRNMKGDDRAVGGVTETRNLLAPPKRKAKRDTSVAATKRRLAKSKSKSRVKPQAGTKARATKPKKKFKVA